ncbi:MAG: SH3 domain-containing protein [Peptostreptococcaceae bacterium]
MIKKTVTMAMLLIAVIFTLGATESYADNTGIVTASKLNVRSGPSTRNKVVGSLRRNNSVTITSSSNGWHKINLNGKEAYVSSQYIKTDNSVVNNEPSSVVSDTSTNTASDTNFTVSETSFTGVITTSKLNVRSGPSTKYGVIGSLRRNNSVNVTGSSNGWYRVNVNGREGYISGQYVKESNSSSNTSTNTSNTSNTMSVVATAYTGYSTTSTGQKPVWGTIAVDPKVIPYGTKVYIPAFDQVFVANNTGGAIKGNKIDIYMNSKSECYNWGRKTIEIQILN